MLKRIVTVGLLVGTVATVSGATVYIASAQQDEGTVETPAQVQQSTPATSPPAGCGVDQETWDAMRAAMETVLGPGVFDAMHSEGGHGAMHGDGGMAGMHGGVMGAGHMGGVASPTD